MERIDPINFDPSWPACAGCNEPATRSVHIGDHSAYVCDQCLHDSTTICHVCPTRIWLADGIKMQDGTIECASCASLDPKHVAGRVRELRRDVTRDEFDQVRR